MSPTLKAVTAETFEPEVVRASYDLPVLVDFWAEWCGPCKRMEPVFELLQKEFQDRLTIAGVDIDRNFDISIKYAVMSIPTFCLFRNGKIIWRHSGTLSFETFKDALRKELSDAS